MSVSALTSALMIGLARPVELTGALEEQLVELAREGSATWPELQLSDTDFIEYLGAHLELSAGDCELPSRLGQLRIADLYIACACSRGDSLAITAFESRYFGGLDAARASVRQAPISPAELRQQMRYRLFVAQEGKAPRIAGYMGRGSLLSWVRITATRLLLDLVRKPDHERYSDDAGLAELAVADDDPEVALLKRQCRVDFKQAFSESMGRLTARQRNLLRQRYLHGLSVNEVAGLYGLHRVTASRALSEARAALQEAIRDYFVAQLELDRPDLDQVLELISSQLELSLSRLLDGAAG